MQHQALPQTQRRFMCLEDRLLETIYKAEGITLQQAADKIHITTDAAHSIVNRINRTHPRFLRTKADALNADLWLSPDPVQIERVDQFLNKGGFTRINEKEFLKYYRKEVKLEKRQARLERIRTTINNRKWYISTAILIGSSLAAAFYLNTKKRV